ncbi:MAG: 6-carboxytetrahydropterin synthase [Bdellovibrionales bacterium]|nr:6-carboxytetrahydropterin synthase [Bdellovibrionales bacterium]
MEKAIIARKIHFSCGHRYYNPEWDTDKNKEIYGNYYSEYGFGHNYTLEAYISGAISPETGIIQDIRELDDYLKKVTDRLDHKFLNEDVDNFSDKVPTSENIALYCYKELKRFFTDSIVDLVKIKLIEGEDLWVEIGEGSFHD